MKKGDNLKKVFRYYWDRLEALPYRQPGNLTRQEMPDRPGVYVFRRRKLDLAAVYIGSAIGGEGLRRVWNHLCPYRLEIRMRGDGDLHHFQWSCPTDYWGRPAIDKSSFRRDMGFLERIAPGQPTVNYIFKHFVVSWLILPKKIAKDVENSFLYLKPRYNLNCHAGFDPLDVNSSNPELLDKRTMCGFEDTLKASTSLSMSVVRAVTGDGDAY